MEVEPTEPWPRTSKMKLFEVTNGYIAESYVRLLVIESTKEKALETAREKYKKEGTGIQNYESSYWEDLQATELCGDTSKEWCNEIIDG